MPSFEAIPAPKRERGQEKTQEELEKLEMEKKVTEKVAGFKVDEGRMGRYREAVEETEREIARKRFTELNPSEREELIYQLFKENRLSKKGGVPPHDNVVDFQEYRERKIAEVPTETKNQEPEVAQPEPEIPTPEVPPQTEIAPQAEAAPEPEPVPPTIHRWLTNLEPYTKKIDSIEQKLEAAREADRRNPRIHKLNPLGGAFHANYPVIRKELSALLKEVRQAAKRENLAVNDPYVKKNLRRFISEIEQRIFELKSQTKRLEHLKHPLRSARKIFR